MERCSLPSERLTFHPGFRRGNIDRDGLAAGAGGKARYVRVSAKNLGVCPSWHLGRREAWMFVDEIVVDK